jgi:hypothetical protein
MGHLGRALQDSRWAKERADRWTGLAGILNLRSKQESSVCAAVAVRWSRVGWHVTGGQGTAGKG